MEDSPSKKVTLENVLKKVKSAYFSSNTNINDHFVKFRMNLIE